MVKPCSVIYFPGSGGRFFVNCLSLSKETAPYYHRDLNTLTDDEIFKLKMMSVKERRDIHLINDLKSFTKFHKPDEGVYEPHFNYENPLIDNLFDWVIVTNHLNNYHERLPWLKKIFYLDLDWQKYGHWIQNAGSHFEQYSFQHNFKVNYTKQYYRPTADQEDQSKVLQNYGITTTISMTLILDSKDNFVQQYLIACDEIKITPEIDTAIDLYQNWRRFRVDPFL